MENKQALKDRVIAAIDEDAQHIIDIGHRLQRTPELGFKETKSAETVAREFADLGIPFQDKIALTGVRAELAGSKAGPCVAVMGELDALLCPSHAHANPATGASHVCGHNAQVASMLGVGRGLLRSGVMDSLTGKVVLFAVPAEEYVDLDYRLSLKEQGKIEFLSGKSELVRLGAFKSVDMAMMAHAWSNQSERKLEIGGTGNGFLVKKVTFQGKAAHAASRPDQGINALNAAALAIMAINAQRETFPDQDHVRVSLVMSSGGDMINIVPERVCLDIMVRARNLEAVFQSSAKVDRAVTGAALSVGATATIDDLPGYLPFSQDHSLSSLFRQNASRLLPAESIVDGGHRAGSTDLGDLSHLMPVLHPFIGGVKGAVHSCDFEIVDEEMLYVVVAKLMAMTIIDLLADQASTAKEIMADFVPRLTNDEYLQWLRSGTLGAIGQ